jgi:hypothetical protein
MKVLNNSCFIEVRVRSNHRLPLPTTSTTQSLNRIKFSTYSVAPLGTFLLALKSLLGLKDICCRIFPAFSVLSKLPLAFNPDRA